jgi:cell division protease FtsH
MTRDELRDRICVMLAGRVAEEIACGDISTGAQNDLERTTETARQMVCRFGMSDKLGLQTYGPPASSRFLDSPTFGEPRNFSDLTARLIDAEIRDIIDTEHTRTRRIIEERRDLLEIIAGRLLEAETLERAELEAILGTPNPLDRESAGQASEE